MATEQLREHLLQDRDALKVASPGLEAADAKRSKPARRQTSSRISTMKVDSRSLWVGVHLDDPVRRLENEELEGVVRLVGGEPDELARARLDRRLEHVRVCGAHVRADSVRSDDQVVALELVRVRRLRFVVEPDAEVTRPLLHEGHERRA